MKLLCAADLHLGRRPSRLPDEIVDETGLAAAVTPQAAWRALVDFALAERVHAVLLAGDLLDDEHDFYGTFGDLREGVERLIAGGVGVLAVSGNHDVEVLPRLAGVVPELWVLGQGGVWEVATLTNGATTVHVAGWSYPSGAVTRSPVAQLAEALADLPRAQVVGLLHCDRDQPGSRYAPVSSSELAAAPVDVWLLGHVHKPDFGALPGSSGARQLSGYLGSLSAGDPGEEGQRGAWLLEIAGDGASVGAGVRASVDRVPLAGLRYETISVDVDDLAAAEDLGPRVMTAVTEFITGLADAAPVGSTPLRAVGLRLRLVGRSASRAELAARLRVDDPREAVLRVNGVVSYIHDVRLEALPAIDLAAIANGRDPLALAARKLLLLDEPADPARAVLITSARRQLERTLGSKYYTALPEPDLSDDAVVESLRHAALTLIDAMVNS